MARRAPLTLAVAAAACLWGGAAARAGAETAIRVALVEAAPHVELAGPGLEVAAPDGIPAWRTDRLRAWRAGPGLDADGRHVAALRVVAPGAVRLGGREYAGTFDLLPWAGGVAVVNELPLEDYVAGVLRAEAGDRWPAEALRALAVAARTYGVALASVGAGPRGPRADGQPWHVLASTAHQQFAGRVPTGSAVAAAARDTAGVVLRLDGRLFAAFYHSDSGGWTEDARRVFTGASVPDLRGVPSPLATGSPHARWVLDVTLAELGEHLGPYASAVGTVTGLEVVERTRALRAATVLVRGTAGAARVRGADFRRLVGVDRVRSTLFAVAVADGVARFAGRGWGHGVGLCQAGARGMAARGHGWREILAAYYPDATLGRLGPARPPSLGPARPPSLGQDGS